LLNAVPAVDHWLNVSKGLSGADSLHDLGDLVGVQLVGLGLGVVVDIGRLCVAPIDNSFKFQYL
jgi:hypothetical protein